MNRFFKRIKPGNVTLQQSNGSYLPDRRQKGVNAMEDLLKNLTATLISRLDDIEKETNFDYLLKTGQDDIYSEAVVLFEEMQKLKNRLQSL